MMDLFSLAGIDPGARAGASLPPAPPAAPDSCAASAAEQLDPAFSAIAAAIRGWTVRLAGQPGGEEFANARHVRLVLRALEAERTGGYLPEGPSAVALLRQVLDLVRAGHVQLRPELGVLALRDWAEWQVQAARAVGETTA